jgi:hypothetical protein
MVLSTILTENTVYFISALLAISAVIVALIQKRRDWFEVLVFGLLIAAIVAGLGYAAFAR